MTTSDRLEIPAAQLHLPRQAILSMQALTEGQQRYRVRLIGEESPISLIVTAPIVDSKLISVREQQPFVARTFVGKEIIAFRTQVLKVYHAPFHHLHLAWPTSVERMSIRKSARVEVELPASLTKENESGAQSVQLVDLSATGARVISGLSVLSVGDIVKIAFRIEMEAGPEDLTAQAIVRSCQSLEHDGGPRHTPRESIGLEFVELNREERMLLTAYVFQCSNV